MIEFGPSGTGERFYDEGHKHTEEAPLWLKNQGLNLFEYSFGRGINLTAEKGKVFNDAFSRQGVKLSVHAPYFINFANPEDDKAENSYNYVLNSARMATIMGATRVIFHPASQGKEDRKTTVNRTKLRLDSLAERIYKNKLDNITYCPETMGKLNQIGTIEEIVDFCKIDNIYLPTIDFGHVNAREQGSLKTTKDFEDRLKYMADELGFERVKHFHVHFSKIEYSAKGEVRHLTFLDNVYGPNYEPFIDACVKLGFEPRVICESAGTQTDDSISMMSYYNLITKKH